MPKKQKAKLVNRKTRSTKNKKLPVTSKHSQKKKVVSTKRKTQSKKTKQISLGGTAFAEGVMLRTRNNMAVAMVDDSGVLEVASFDLKNIKGKYDFWAIPFVRGIFFFIESVYFFLKISIVKRPFVKKNLKQKPPHERIWTRINQYFVYIIYFFLLVGFFDYLYVKLNSVGSLGGWAAFYGFIFSLLYICLFIVLFILVSIGRKSDLDIFSYHGVEHKIINTYERGDKITLENLNRAGLINDRCSIATFFWAVVILAFLVTFLKINQAGWFLSLLATLGLIFISFSFAYELVRIAYSSGSRFLRSIFISPLHILQLVLTHEPSEEQLRVGIVAFDEVMRLEKESQKTI